MKNIEDKLAAFLMDYGVLKNADAEKMAHKIAEMFEKEREELQKKLSTTETVLKHNLEHAKCSKCGDSNMLLYCQDCYDNQRAQLAAKPDRISRHVMCMYCNKEYSFEESDQLADHIMSCEKSPLVQMNAQLMEVANLLIGSSDSDSVIIEAEKRIKSLPENPILKQRDSLRTELDKLRCAHGNVCDNAAITEKERDQLAAKCAAYKRVIDLAWEDRRDDSDTSYVGLLAEARCNDDCGKGWLSPEKKERLREALQRLLPFASAYSSHQKRNPEDKLYENLDLAKQALSETK